MAWGQSECYPQRQNGREKIIEEHTHQDEDGACGSGLMGKSGGKAVAVNVLDLLVHF